MKPRQIAFGAACLGLALTALLGGYGPGPWGTSPNAGDSILARVVRAEEPSEFRQLLDRLEADDWRERDAAARRLVEIHPEWVHRVASDWEPDGAEARWRWRWVHARLDDLRTLPILLAEPRPDALEWRLRRLESELGLLVVDQLERLALRHSDPRVRQRSVEWAVELAPDLDPVFLARAATDASPVVRRTVYRIAARPERAWLVTELRRILAPGFEDPPRVEEALRAVRVHRLRELRSLVASRWDEATDRERFEIARVLAEMPRPGEIGRYLWLLEYGDYRGLTDAIYALEVALPDLASETHSVLARVLGAESVQTNPTVALRSLHLVKTHGDVRLALDLLPYLESADTRVAHSVGALLIEWDATEYFTDVVATIGETALTRR